MYTRTAASPIASIEGGQSEVDLLRQYESGAVPLPRKAIDSFHRHLAFDHVVEPDQATMRQRFQAIGRSIRDLLAQRWLKAKATYYRENPKRVYYLSMEFLIGRSLSNNMLNMMIDPLIREMMQEEGVDLLALAETEPDAGLGNGGLGRLAACFLDSLATLQIPAHGYGLRYEYGVFRQEIRNGFQTETPTTGCGARIPGKSFAMPTPFLSRSTRTSVSSAGKPILRAIIRLFCSAFLTTVPSSDSVARTSIRCVCGARPLPSSSTFWSSVTATTLEPCWIR
jgi:hypothetical protein